MRLGLSTAILSVALLGCCPQKPDDCVEDSVSVTQGVYGRLVVGDDVDHDPDCVEYARPGEWYDVYFVTPDLMHVVGSDTTNEDGAYEIPLPGGDYAMCLFWPYESRARCDRSHVITVPAAGRVRADLATGVLVVTSAAVRGESLCGREP